jgi:hypothetical protein
MDFQNRAKNGRIVNMPYGGAGLSIEEDMRTLVKNGSNLAKLMQLYVIAFDGSVQMTDSRKVLAGVDGNLERFSMLGLSQLKKTIGAQKATEKLRNDILRDIVGKGVK